MSRSCERFSDATDIFLWAELVRNTVGFNATALEECEPTICRALWGTGNPDISGIGVAVGYVLEAAGGFLLALTLWALETFPHRLRRLHRQFYKPLVRGMAAFFSSAVFFSLAIEIASTVVLARRDFLLGDDGLGLHEAQMTWAISVACVLPLLYPVAMVNLWTKKSQAAPDGLGSKRDTITSEGSNGRETRERNPERNYAMVFFYLVLATFSYPFLSQCANNWRAEQIGEGKAPDGKPSITREEMAVVVDMCFRGAPPLSAREYRILWSFELVASLVVVLFALWLVIKSTVLSAADGDREAYHDGPGLKRFLGRTSRSAAQSWRRFRSRWDDSPRLVNAAQLLAIMGPMLLAGPLLWGVFRIREAQEALAESSRNIYADNDWSFGQVAALVMFLPVLSEMVFVWWYQFDGVM